MNSESFAEYLAQPAKLYQLPYQEIKNLVEEYPYSANLRLMMLIKSKIEQDPAFETHLHQLAAHTFDRNFLFDLDHEALKDMLDLATGTEERLELEQLSVVEEKELLAIDVTPLTEDKPAYIAKAIPIPTITESITEPLSFQEELIAEEDIDQIETPSSQAPIDKEEKVSLSESIISEAPEADPSPIISSPVDPFEVPADVVDTISLIPILTTNGQIQAKESFSAWQAFLQENKQAQLNQLREKAQQNSCNFNVSTQQAAAKSVKQKPGVATETLAKLLERQGSYQKAIKMYEQLSLLNPEKSRYFAATIEKLKQNI